MTEPWPDDPVAFMTTYMAAWNAADLDRICDAYHVPALIYHEGTVYANSTPDARRAYLADFLDGTRPELAAGARWESPAYDVVPAGEGGAVVTTRWVFRRPDGTVAEDYPDTYVLVRIDGRWAIMADVL